MTQIKNLEKMAERIKKAVDDKERIIIYGDSDLDGTTSVIVLKETIQSLGGKVSAIYFPDREKEGYGITKKGLAYLKEKAPALFICVDLGIGNFEEVLLAKKMGFTVLIADHHETLGKVPKADILVDPKQKGDKYPFKFFAAVGIVYKLSELILGDKLKGNLKDSFLELAALGTVADMMPRQDDNRMFVEDGLPSLKSSFRPGIKVFWKNNYFEKEMDFNHKTFKIISLLNIRDVQNGYPASFRLLTATSIEEADKIIKVLLKKDILRKKKIIKMMKMAEKQVGENDEKIIFIGGSKFESILMSSVASMLCRDHGKPVFVYKKMAKESMGTARAGSKTNLVDLMKKCSKLLITFGGHPPAAGFRVENKNLNKFKECLISHMK
jgi:single-stranded-DNA-specific exonuclease